MKKEATEEKTSKKGANLKGLTKSSVWDLQENDVFRLLEAGGEPASLHRHHP